MVYLTPRGVALLFDVPMELVEEALEGKYLIWIRGLGIEYRRAEDWSRQWKKASDLRPWRYPIASRNN